MNDRRNELQQNELADSLGRINTAIEPYSKLIAIGAALVIVALVGFALLKSEEAANTSQATFGLLNTASSGNAEAIEQIYQANPDSLAGGWAAVFAGDALLAKGVNDLFSDRETGLEQIEDALKSYQKAVNFSGDSVLVSRAHLGIAKANEAKGDVEAAIAAYEKLVPVAESDAVREFAEDRIVKFQRPDTKQFMAWFNEQDFSPPKPTEPLGLPGLGGLPGEPDLGLPPLDFGSSTNDDDADTETEAETGGGDTDEAAAEPAAMDGGGETVSGGTASGEASAEETATEAAATEKASTAEAAGPEEASMEQSVTEQSGTEESVTEESGTAESKTESGTAESGGEEASEEPPAGTSTSPDSDD
ncbi:MAG: tetratricopeptide repeat protein [Planctomycetota bacterium]